VKAAMNRRTSRRPSGAHLVGQDENPCGIGRDARAAPVRKSIFKKGYLDKPMSARIRRSILWAAAIMLALWPGIVHADSVGSKNKTGNRLFEQGNYQEAEKAYLDAQARMPGKPELSYNLGNSLIKQKKYDQALQSLRLALSRGDKALQANSWYNAGNALYDMGNFRDSAQAFIQSLRLNPSDRDAKHNLELALKKMQEQQQNSQGKPDSKQQNAGKDQKSNQGNSQANRQDNKPSDESQSQQARPDGGITKERALQILDALRNQEVADQRKLLEHAVRRKAFARDW
jgi:Ca-activated chloride channel homolog